MRKIAKKLLSALCAITLLLSSSMVALAAETESAVIPQTKETSNQGTLVDIVYFSIDGNGEVKTSEVPISTYGWLDDRITGSFSFYDLGMKNGNHYYETHMNAVAIDDVTFSYAKFSAKPKSNTEYIDSETLPKHKTFANDVIQYYYTGDGPSSPTVSVKASFTTNAGTYKIPVHTLKNPIES